MKINAKIKSRIQREILKVVNKIIKNPSNVDLSIRHFDSLYVALRIESDYGITEMIIDSNKIILSTIILIHEENWTNLSLTLTSGLTSFIDDNIELKTKEEIINHFVSKANAADNALKISDDIVLHSDSPIIEQINNLIQIGLTSQSLYAIRATNNETKCGVNALVIFDSIHPTNGQLKIYPSGTFKFYHNNDTTIIDENITATINNTNSDNPLKSLWYTLLMSQLNSYHITE